MIYTFTGIYAQPLIPLDQNYSRAIDNYTISNVSSFPTFVRPFAQPYLDNYVKTDSLFSFSIKSSEPNSGWFARKWRYESFFEVDTTGFKLDVDPLFDFQLAQQKNPKTYYYTNTRGIIIHGNLNKELYFQSTYYEDQATFPAYLSDYINSSKVVPGQSYMRHYHGNGFDYGHSSGVLYYQLNQHFEFSFGQDKLFVGDGYRSLLLSDVPYSYPFFRASFTNKYIQYTRIMAVLLANKNPLGSFDPREKYLGGFNICTIMPSNQFQLSFFEGSVWDYPNEVKNIHLNYNYFNPLIYANSLVKAKCFDLGGGGFKLNLFHSIQSYGQIVFGNFSSNNRFAKNNLGLQLGEKYINAFTLPGFTLQAEYNYAANDIYGSSKDALNYSHYNQPLGHPFGNNFKELVLGGHYNFKCWFIDIQVSKYHYGNDTASFLPNQTKYIKEFSYHTPFIGEGPVTKVFYTDMSVSYLINAKSNRRIVLGMISRNSQVLNVRDNLNYFYIAFRATLINKYYDF